MDIRWIIGQIFGIIAVILGFVMYQIKDAKRLLMVKIFICIVFCIHYFFLKATSGMILNAVGAVRSITYYNRDRVGKYEKYLPVVFAIIMGIMGIYFWEAWYSVFVVVGLVINSVALSFKNPQNLRKSILISSPLVIIYNAFIMSIGGIIFESVSVISSVIGLIRYKNSQKQTSLKH